MGVTAYRRLQEENLRERESKELKRRQFSYSPRMQAFSLRFKLGVLRQAASEGFLRSLRAMA